MNNVNKNNNKGNILIKTPQYEISLEDLCKKEYLKINNLMHMIEKQFKISLHDYPELRGEILSISNFIKRIPNYEREIL
ncbi:MAG: hypothetical protein M0R51_09080 [Clostridia bacterium]|jgi:hypothetical protein|nr:hypothetical protein [Clostridia bacterium]